VIDGPARRQVGHLSGRSERRSIWTSWGASWGTPRRIMRWLVRGQGGSSLTVEAGCPRAGYSQVTKILP
jgi:hypothetical protein